MATDILSKIKAADDAKKKALSSLHKELGYASAQALAEALLDAAAAGPAPSAKSAKAAAIGSAPKAPAKSGKGKGRGRRIPDETRQAISAALTSGVPGNRLTTQFGVSYGVIHEIKTQLGLVNKQDGKKRKKKAASKSQ